MPNILASHTNDPVLSSYLREFSKSFNYENLKESDLFEFFSAYCVFHRDYSEHTDLEDVIVAGGLDSAIDSAAIFINGVYVESTSQVDEISSRVRIDVDYAFVQAKTSRNLSAAEIGSFIQGVKEFFSDRYMPVNDDIQKKRLLSDYVFSLSVKMRSKPSLSLFYCYTGKYINDANIVARVEAGKAALRDLDMFSDIEFTFLDANALQGRYQEINLRVEKEIQINEYASLPQIAGIRQAYIGIIPCIELVKLLSNSDGRLQKSLFNENVRDFLSRNPVNDEIRATLISKDNQSRLAALNNGITIVAKNIRIVGKKFTLEDFQIVNGCQTSNLIFECREKLAPETSVTVKMIQAEDKDLINEIVRATNRQTEVKDETFEVLGEFHKSLERFFFSLPTDVDHKLVYERRKRQYSDSAFTAKNIVTLNFLTTSFVSCFLNNPVDAIDYFGVLLKKHSGNIFADGHSMWPYVASATIMRELEKLCTGRARRDIWKFRFILALIVRQSFGKAPRLSDHKNQLKYCGLIIDECRDKDKFLKRLTAAERKIAEAIGAQGPGFDHRNAQQDRKFVEKIIDPNV